MNAKTRKSVLSEVTARLRDGGIPEPESDAWILFSYVTGLDRTHYLLEQEQPATEESRPEQPDLRIPNVISPNGDNINDYFVIENIGETTHNQLTIYTRNGKVVYDRKDYDNSWNAENLPAGTYLYWFSFEYAGHEFMRQGSVKVIR